MIPRSTLSRCCSSSPLRSAAQPGCLLVLCWLKRRIARMCCPPVLWTSWQSSHLRLSAIKTWWNYNIKNKPLIPWCCWGWLPQDPDGRPPNQLELFWCLCRWDLLSDNSLVSKTSWCRPSLSQQVVLCWGGTHNTDLDSSSSGNPK